MLNLMLFTGRGSQNVRINGAKWSLTGPHPSADRRLINRSNGNIRTVAAGSSMMEWFLEGIDGAQHALSLGYTANGSLAQNVKINECVPAYLYTQKQLDSLRPNTYRDYSNSHPVAMWDLTKVIETSNVWLGVFASGAVTVGAARIKLFYGFVAKLGDKQNVYFIGGDSGALALGLGGSADAGFGIMTGFSTAQQMVGHTSWDLGFKLGPVTKFARSVKTLQNSSRVSQRGTDLLRSLRALRALRFPGGIQKISDDKGKILNAVKLGGIGAKIVNDSGAREMLLNAACSFDSHEGAKALLGLAGVDGTQAGLEIMAIGPSAELSVYAGVSQVTFAVKVQPRIVSTILSSQRIRTTVSNGKSLVVQFEKRLRNLIVRGTRRSQILGAIRSKEMVRLQITLAIRAAGFEYDTRKHLFRRVGFADLNVPFKHLGADDSAGPNYTKQPVVTSYYE